MNMNPKNLLYKFLSLFFHLLYHQFAWGYDFVAFVVSAGRWRTWVKSVGKYLTGPSILEIGHGPGHLQTHLKNTYPQLIGLDESRQMGKQAQKNIRAAYPRLPQTLVRAKAQSIPFINEQFNTVVATFPAQFIFEKSCLKEIHCVLKPGGTLVILLAVKMTGKDFISRLLGILYTVTGETIPQEIQQFMMKSLIEQGFSPQINWLHQKNDHLLLINAQKM